MTESANETTKPAFRPQDADYFADSEAVAASASLQQALSETGAQPPVAPIDVLEGHFQVKASDLHNAALATKLFGTLSKTADNLLIQVELFECHFRLSSTFRSVTCSFSGPLKPEAGFGSVGRVRLFFPQWQLEAIAASLANIRIAPRPLAGKMPVTRNDKSKARRKKARADMENSYIQIDAVKNGWWLRQGNYVGQFTSETAETFDETCWDRSTAGTSIVVADTRMLQRALRYVDLFAANDSAQPHFSVLEIRDGHCIGGAEEGVAYFACSALRDLKFHIAVQDVPILCRVLHCMSGHVSLSETDTHYLFETMAIQCAIKKPQVHFPLGAELLFQTPVMTATQMPVSGPLKSLLSMSIAQHAYDQVHPLELSLDAQSRKLSYFCWSADATSRAANEAWPTSNDPFQSFDGKVDLLGLQTAVGCAAPGSHIELAVVNNKGLKVTNREDNITTEVIFALRPR
jgi:hypothetical protein